MPRGKTSTNKCFICDKNISLFAYNRHMKAHDKKTKQNELSKNIILSCVYCDKIFSNKIGLGNHQTRCPKNSNRTIQTMTDEGKKRISIKNKARIWDDAARIKHSNAMKIAVEKYPESYTSSNRGRTKQIVVDNIKLQGKWEVDFYLWAKKQGLNPQRNVRGFKYVWNGERTYYPDFYIESLDLYIEIKGYETDRDRAKWLNFSEKLCIIKEKEIKEIRKGCFVGL